MKMSLCSLGMILSTTAAGWAIPVLNGDFESGSLAGWTSSGFVQRASYAASTGFGLNLDTAAFGDGYASFNFGDNVPDGVLFQDLATVIGTSYTVIFFYGNFSAAGVPTTQSLLAEAIDTGTTSVLSTLVANASLAGNQVALSQILGAPSLFTYSFTAIGTSTRIRFRDVGSDTGSTDGFLDSITVTEAPELNRHGFLLTLLFVGLSFLLAERRRRIV